MDERRRFEQFIQMLYLKTDEGGFTVECNYCSEHDYQFGDNLAEAVGPALVHFREHHPGRLPYEGPTQEEEEAAISSIKGVM